MKTWKKVASMLLAAAMTTSFAACGAGGGNDDGGGNIPTGNKQLATRYATAISDAMEAKSVKLTGSLAFSATEYYYVEGTTTVDPNLTVLDEATAIAVEIVISEDTEGYAMQMKMDLQDGVGEDAARLTSEMILKGQYLYSRSYIPGAGADTLWGCEDLGIPMDVETIVETELGVDWAVIEEMLGAQEIKDATSAAREALVNGIYTQLENGGMVDNSLAIEVNFAPFINGWIEYINSVDETTKTLGVFVDEVLAKAGVPISYAVLLDTIAAFSEKTVPEAIDTLDAMLVENGTTLQATLDAVLDSELLEMILANAGADADVIAQIKLLTVADIKAQFEGVTVHDMMNAILASANEEGSMGEDPWTSVLQLLMAAKDATLEEMGIEMPNIPATLNDLTVGGSISFNAAGTAVTAISVGCNLEVKVEFGGETSASGSEGLPGYGVAAFEVNLAFAEFSSSAVVISAPAANQIAAE